MPSGHCSVSRHALKAPILVCQKFPMHLLVLCVCGGRFVVHVALKITAVVAVVADVQVYAQKKNTANSLVAQLSSKLPPEWS